MVNLSEASPMAGFLSRLWPFAGKRGPERALSAEAVHPILADQVWSGFSDEGEEYLCLRLSKASEGLPDLTQKIRSLPLDSSYQLLAAGRISVTLDFSPNPRGRIVSFHEGGVQ